jgi:hypothetical protein
MIPKDLKKRKKKIKGKKYIASVQVDDLTVHTESC